ncbi:MAG TPA: GNAT family N-acetyltransferase [Bryobacteraceae bacterium]|nr:GNAT family N-acetyltransferase [Bryobacteraceae bacterium]
MRQARSADLLYRPAELLDVPALARLRAQEWGTTEYWITRLTRYLSGEANPQKALPQRAVFVGQAGVDIAGFIAGHLTTRFDCQGELEWINVDVSWRRSGVGSGLLSTMAAWFAEHRADRICVNVEPDNTAAMQFYARHGAVPLNRHWMVWPDLPLARRRIF